MKKEFTIKDLILSITLTVCIGLIIIPFVNKLFKFSENKVFEEMLNNINDKTVEDYNKYFKESTYDCVIYNINEDLVFDDLGTYTGYSIVKNGSVYLSVHNKDISVNNVLFVNKNTIMDNSEKYNGEDFNIEDIVNKLECKDYTLVEK